MRPGGVSIAVKSKSGMEALMSIIAALLAAMGVVGVLLWRVNQASDAAKGLLETAEDTRGFFRRMAWRRKAGKNQLDALTDPREAAAAMMAAVAQWDAAISDREMDAIRAQVRQYFGANEEQSHELLAMGRWLSRDASDIGSFLRRASTIVLAKCSQQERKDLLAMLNAVATAEGKPRDVLEQELVRFADYVSRAALPRTMN
jgi:uncharacterized tellurite resistance protein B-like protein